MGNKKRQNPKIHGFQTVTLTISTALVLVLIGLVVVSVFTARNLSNYFKENLSVSLYLNQSLTNEQGKNFANELSKKTYVLDVKYISKDDVLNEEKKEMGIDPSEFAGSNPFSSEVELHLAADYANRDSLSWIKEELKKNESVSEVTCRDELVDQVNDTLQKINIVLLVLAGVLAIVSFALINNTVRLGVYSRRFAIRTMKLVGASWWFIRWPFLKNALLVGVLSSVLACCVLGGAFYVLSVQEPDVLTVITEEVLAITGVAVFLVGILITFSCAFFSVNKYLRMKAGDLYKI